MQRPVVAQSVLRQGKSPDDWGSIHGSGLDFFFLATASRPALGPTQSPTQWVPRALSPGVKRPGCELTTHLHLLPRLRMREALSSIPKYVFTAWCLLKQWIHLHGVVLS
jgi:hypothetical protein